MANRKVFQRWYWVTIGVFILGMLSVAMLIWTNNIYERQRANLALTSALMDVRMKAATFHLWLEEALGGEPSIDAQKLLSDLDRAIRLSRTILEGGQSEHGFLSKPQEGSRRQRDTEEMVSLLSEFKKIALERIQAPEISGIGSPLDDRFDAVFKKLEENLSGLQEIVKKRHVLTESRSRRLSVGILLAWTVVLIAAMVALWNKEKRRVRAEEALRIANEDLQSQASELERHRGHLLELVQERTVDLTSANMHLEQEILERKVREKELGENKERLEKLSSEFRTLLEAITDPLTLLSPDFKVLWANHSMACGMGREISDMEASYCYTRWHHLSTPCEGCPAAESFRTGKEEITQIEGPDGKLWEMRAYPVKEKNGEVRNVLTVAVDITEKMTLQKEAMRAAHLASLGELAAGVAHEINNPINGIINYAQILVDDRNGMNGDNEIPHRIIKEGNRISTIVRSLLSFARERKEDKNPVRIQDILSDTFALSGTQLRKDGILLKTGIPAGLPIINAHPQQIQQVFLNILNNARYALNQKYPRVDENKIIEIRGEEIDLNGRLYLEITFHDRGIGIPAGILSKVIDPFFSTKPKAVGTGLGLSISHGIISDHGGKLTIQSVEGEFTKVVICLPAWLETGKQ